MSATSICYNHVSPVVLMLEVWVEVDSQVQPQILQMSINYRCTVHPMTTSWKLHSNLSLVHLVVHGNNDTAWWLKKKFWSSGHIYLQNSCLCLRMAEWGYFCILCAKWAWTWVIARLLVASHQQDASHCQKTWASDQNKSQRQSQDNSVSAGWGYCFMSIFRHVV